MNMEKTEFKSGEASPLQKLYNYFSAPINLDEDHRASGVYAWAFIIGSIIAYDYYAIKTKKAETLTRFFWRQTESPIKAVIPISIWTTLTVHLILEKTIRRKAFSSK